MNHELIYLRKRTTEDMIQIRKFTIENHELKKHNEILQLQVNQNKNKFKEDR